MQKNNAKVWQKSLLKAVGLGVLLGSILAITQAAWAQMGLEGPVKMSDRKCLAKTTCGAWSVSDICGKDIPCLGTVTTNGPTFNGCATVMEKECTRDESKYGAAICPGICPSEDRTDPCNFKIKGCAP